LKTKLEVLTKGELNKGARQLIRLEVIIDVLFALMIYRIFMMLPRPEIDGFTRETLMQALTDDPFRYLMMLVGMIMILIYWNQNNMQFGYLKRANAILAGLSLLQSVFLMVYLYFVRLDMEFDGAVVALEMESVFLALAGFIGVWCWHYANKKGLVTEELGKEERDNVYRKLFPEPITSVLTFPFAAFGPDIWTISWLLLFPVTWIVNWRRRKIMKKSAGG
jgi:uncharacterized membrane protein